MTEYVTVPLTEQIYKRVSQLAKARQQNIGEAIAEYLADTLPAAEVAGVVQSEFDPAVEREKEAYLQLYPELKGKYKGRYVAIHEGKLVDHDEDYGTLFERIDDRYPDEFVWLACVEDEPIGTLVFRSPRFVTEES